MLVAMIAALCAPGRSTLGQSAASQKDAGAAVQDQNHVDGSSPAEDPWARIPGKVVVLIFVRTDCPIANRYAVEISRLQAAHATDATFWLVYPDKRETPEAIRKHDLEYHLALPVLRDPQRALAKRAQVSVTPEAAVFDVRGHLVYHGRIDNLYETFGRARPAPTTHELEDAIQAIRTGHSPATKEVAAIGCYISDLR